MISDNEVYESTISVMYTMIHTWKRSWCASVSLIQWAQGDSASITSCRNTWEECWQIPGTLVHLTSYWKIYSCWWIIGHISILCQWHGQLLLQEMVIMWSFSLEAFPVLLLSLSPTLLFRVSSLGRDPETWVQRDSFPYIVYITCCFSIIMTHSLWAALVNLFYLALQLSSVSESFQKAVWDVFRNKVHVTVCSWLRNSDN